MTLHSKKRGRPLGSKNKSKGTGISKIQAELIRKLAPKPKRGRGRPRKVVETFKRPDNDKLLLEMSDKYIVLVVENAELNSKVANLEHQAIGYQAVISYLEHQLRNNDGAPV